MKPQFPAGPSTRRALYGLGLLAALKALSLVLMGQAVASVLAGLMIQDAAWGDQLGWGAAGVVLRSVTVWAQGVAARRAALGVKEELRAQLLETALRNGVRAAGPSDGGLAVLATRGLDALDSYYTQYLPAVVNCAAIPLLLGARILFADWVSAVVIVLTVPLVPVFMVLIGRYTEDKVREAQAALSRLSGHMLELAKGLPVLVGLGRAAAQRRALEDISEDYRQRTMGTLRTAFLSALALELIATISVAVVAVFIGVRLVHGDMALEAGLLALILAPDCYLPLRELGTAHHASDDGRAALAETTAVLDAPEPRRLVPVPAAVGGPAGVTVRDLTVSYPGRQGTAVGPLSFSAPAGLVTALDGPSGAGKSTVLGVLAGTVGTGGGTAVSGTVGGFAAGDVAWVPQHPVMVADTVREEVLLYLTAGTATAGKPAAGSAVRGEADSGGVLRCLAAVGADHLADKHPAELSPGELRRIALARGLARIEAGATVLLLDEPTAHLDRDSANRVHDAIRALRGRATVILVAHDRQTRELADRIVPLSGHGAAPTHETSPLAPAEATAQVSAGAGHRSAPADGGGAASAVAGSGAGGVPAANARASSPRTAAMLTRLLAPVRGRFAASGIVGALAALFAVALSGLSGWLILRASEQPPILYLLTAIVGVRFFGIGRAVLRYCERLLLHDAVFASLTKLRGGLWASLSQRALSLRRLLQGGNVLGAVIEDVDTVRDLLPRVVLPPIIAVAVAAAASGTVAWLIPAALPAVLAAALVSLVAAPAASLFADRMSAKAEQRLRSGVLRRVAAALDARAELHANAATQPVLAGISALDRDATGAARRSAWAEGLGQALTVAACGAGALYSAVLAAPEVLAGSLPATAVGVVVLLLLALAEPFGAMTTAVRQFPALRAVLRRIGESGVLQPGEPSVNRKNIRPVPRGLGQPGVDLEGLSAAWPGGGAVFSGVSAVAEPGRWLAVTGPSGAGKSTLLAVMLGFLPARAGRIAVTGTAAWCPQEAHLFDSTVRGNLLLGSPRQESGMGVWAGDRTGDAGSIGSGWPGAPAGASGRRPGDPHWPGRSIPQRWRTAAARGGAYPHDAGRRDPPGRAYRAPRCRIRTGADRGPACRTCVAHRGTGDPQPCRHQPRRRAPGASRRKPARRRRGDGIGAGLAHQRLFLSAVDHRGGAAVGAGDPVGA
ncbi:putative ABC transporter permease/ATP-binding protein CydDC [Arthrobacter globiformis NBRC 12137]|uniref:Putative ABC transporter permease/ATP-binding protein CydDC n=1 Tax=Arthrobacter globiformis (strain ATCC 8010 / DSM 20124 / JCM 1332 / NBRC 12137 / NCIMB 8907 / NRRL B-2979 / 168) TaxID=1077972 RepID=H0QM34_ARTG1|nr:putative ABC transporter permease/ATP-binding protein CydDC [Arthrobacter globiformis NBRC 12137]